MHSFRCAYVLGGSFTCSSCPHQQKPAGTYEETSSATTNSNRVSSVEQRRPTVGSVPPQENAAPACFFFFSQQQLNQSELWSPCSTLKPSIINQGPSAKLSQGFKRRREEKFALNQCLSCSFIDFIHLQRRIFLVCAGSQKSNWNMDVISEGMSRCV